MIKLIYSKTFYLWVLDTQAMTPQERADIAIARGACGSFGSGTAAAAAFDRLSQVGVTVQTQRDGNARLYFKGALI
jgi:hypothetical protein